MCPENPVVRGCQELRVVSRRAVGTGDPPEHQGCAHPLGGLLQAGQVRLAEGAAGDGALVHQDRIHRKGGGVVGDDLQVTLRGEALRLAGLGARFRVSRRRARVSVSAWASSGTSRCGSTLVNQEPGPSTTQSASRTAVTASGTAGGSSGSSRTDSTVPGVTATLAWPRTAETAPGWAGSWPRTIASMSSGTADIGSTRPWTFSSRPTQSRAATGSPSFSQSATISRLPTAWPPSPRCR